jgi:YfiH family protein
VSGPELFLTAPSFPVRHGFTLRGGGDLGPASGADEEARANRSRLAGAVGLDPAALILAEQVHGTAVVPGTPGVVPEADGLWTGTPGHWVGIRTADCVPLLLADVEGRRVAAVHSGWRGTEALIGARAVQVLDQAGSPPERLRAAIGPCIGPCCYEVSEDLAERFQALFGSAVVSRRGPKPHLDLRLAVRLSLVATGMSHGSIEDLPGCTACDAGAFFSHRRDKGRTGRHLAFVAPGSLS